MPLFMQMFKGRYVLNWGEGWGISWSCHFSYLVNTRPPLLRQKKTVTLPHSYPSVFYCPTVIFGQISSGIFGDVYVIKCGGYCL